MKPTNKDFKTILVAGADGNLGREIINKLEDNVDNRIIAVSRKITPIINRLDAVTYYTYEELFSEHELKIDIIINCAYPNKLDANEDNLRQTQNLAQNLMQLGIESWESSLYLNISCHCVYREYREIPVSEDRSIDGGNLDLYASHCYTTEYLLESATRSHIKLINLRLADMIGEFYPQPLIDDMIMEAFSKKCITPRNTMNRYSFIDILDVAKAVNEIVEQKKNAFSIFNNNVYNLGYNVKSNSNSENENSKTITTQDIAEILSNSEALRLLTGGITVDSPKNDNSNGTINYSMDSQTLADLLKWQPEISFIDSIENRIIALLSPDF